MTAFHRSKGWGTVCWGTVCWVGMVLLGTALAPAPARGEPSTTSGMDRGWKLSPKLCFGTSCATFTPSDGSSPRTQGWLSEVRLDRPGIVQLPPGTTRIERPSTGQVIQVGPGLLLYQGGSRFSALQPLEMQYLHETQGPGPLEILLPTLILGTEGTRFCIVPVGAAHVQVGVEQGAVWYRRSDQPQTSATALKQGQRLHASSLTPELLQRSLIPPEGMPKARRVTRGLQALPDTPGKLLAALEQDTPGLSSLSDAELVAVAESKLPFWSASERLEVARGLARYRPQNHTAGRVLLQLWAQCMLEPGASDAAQALETLLKDAFSETAWPAILAGYQTVLQQEL